MPSWPRLKEVLGLALEQPPDRRSALLDTLCAGEPELRAEVESLLRAESAAGSFIESPALGALDEARDEDPHLGRQVGPYLVERCIGRGGMGAVYLARRTDEFEHAVAIKMIRRGMDSELVVRRFRHERQILASVNHPHIACLFDGGTTPEGLPYLVMEYVAGTPIDRYADDHRLTTPERLRLCLGVLDAVQHAHDRHIVHRDLKPSNVLVTVDGQPKLLDFGIAKILDPDSDGDSTMTSLARPMTPDYASPEQILGQPITPATDVYALGLLLYELLTGHRPFRFTTHTPDEIASVVCEQEPERPSTAIGRTETTVLADGTAEAKTPRSVSETRDGSPDALRHRLSGALDAIVMKALRKTPASRYPTVAALADDVRRWLEEKPVSAGRDARRYRATRVFHRYRRALRVAALSPVGHRAHRGCGTSLDVTSQRSGRGRWGLDHGDTARLRRGGRVHQPVRAAGGSMALHGNGGDAHHGTGRRWSGSCGAGRVGDSGCAGCRSRHHGRAARRRGRALAPLAGDRLPGAGLVCHARRRSVTSASHRRPRASQSRGTRGGVRRR